MTVYRDNYPNNIEAPQRVYFQYSHDVDFDYSTGKYPLGETYEGFLWESVYIPIEHKVGTQTIGRHVWMRLRIGEKEAWTRPIRLTDSFLNIESTESEQIIGTDSVRFRLKYTLNNGEIVYSEYITLTNGSDGLGISSLDIIGTDLHVTYTDGTEENLGRVKGFDGTGVPIGTDDYNYLVSIGDIPQWRAPIELLNDNITADLPIEYVNGLFSHSDINGYKHIPIGGNSGNTLITDGAGNYSWTDLDFIPLLAIDDTAGSGDTDLLFSADHITSLIAGISITGIKYSVNLETDLVGIPTPGIGELAVVTSDPLYPNRPVYKYDGANWIYFFDLDNNTNFYTKSELNTSGAGGQVHWDNVTNKPVITPFSFSVLTDSGGFTVDDTDVVNILGSGNINISGNAGKNIFIDVPPYTAGSGIGITSNVISHTDTSTVTNTANLGGVVLQNLTFDTFGHVLSRNSINLDTRYSLISHVHSTLTRGTGLTGDNYNGGIPRTFAVDFGTGVNQAARGSHIHTGLPTIISQNFSLLYPFSGVANKVTKYDFGSGNIFITVRLNSGVTSSFGFGYYTLLGTIPFGYRPVTSPHVQPFHYHGGGADYSGQLYILSNGEIRIARNTVTGALDALHAEFSYTI